MSAQRLIKSFEERNYCSLLKAEWHYGATDKPAKKIGDQKGLQSLSVCVYAALTTDFEISNKV